MIGKHFTETLNKVELWINRVRINCAQPVPTFISGPALAMAAIVSAPSVLIILAYLATCKNKGVSVTICYLSNTRECSITFDLIVDKSIEHLRFRVKTYLDFCELLQLVNFSIVHWFVVQGLFARVGSGDPVRVLRLFHNNYTGYCCIHLLCITTYNLSLPRLSANYYGLPTTVQLRAAHKNRCSRVGVSRSTPHRYCTVPA